MAETTYPAPIPAIKHGVDGEVSDQLAAEFNRYATAWEEGAYLTMAEMFADVDYQRIIEMGPAVVPLIFQRLQARPNWWFPALIELTGVDLTTKKSRGNLAETTAIWLKWAREQNIIAGAPVR